MKTAKLSRVISVLLVFVLAMSLFAGCDQQEITDIVAGIVAGIISGAEPTEPAPTEHVHNYEAVVTAPTCTEGGYTTYTCADCGDSYVGDEVAASGHSYEAVVTAPTCTEGGYTTYTCADCGDSYVGDEVASSGHSYEAVVTAPTCTEGGYTTYTCAGCGDSYVGDEVASTDHSFGENEPTCAVCGTANPDYVPPVDVVGAEIIGDWQTPAVAGLKSTYDGNKVSSLWNPAAWGNWSGAPGIVFELNRAADLEKIIITFNSMYYVDVYASADNGASYTFVANINADNAAKAYTVETIGDKTYKTCTLDGLKLEGITHVMLTFNGREIANNTWLGIYEFEVSEEGTDGLDTSWMVPETLKIINHRQTGTFNAASPKPFDGSVGIAKSYDSNLATKWNPRVEPNYVDDPSAAYVLNRPAALKNITLTFGSGIHYFDIYTSADGINYELLVSVNAENEAEYFVTEGSNYVCALDELNLEGVTHVKVTLTGRANNGTYVNLLEIAVSE